MKKSFRLFAFLFLLFSFSSKAQELKSKTFINHIAVHVVDLTKSTDFYQKIIGLDTIPEPFHDGKHTWFSVGSDVQLHLIQGASAATKQDKNSHLCFSVPSVPQFIEELKKNKIGFEDWLGEKGAVTTRVDGVKQIYFTDPDGYWVEINDAGSAK